MEEEVNRFYSDNALRCISVYFTSTGCFSPRERGRSVLGKETEFIKKK